MLTATMFAAELNIYASGLRAGSMSGDKKVQLTYVLNAPATSVTINVSGGVIAPIEISDATMLTKGSHTYTLDVTSFPVGSYSWEVVASAAANDALTNVIDYDKGIYNYYLPQGLAVDNNPESPFFGRIYVSESTDGASDGGTARTKAMTRGVYIYDALLEDITSQGTTGYIGGLTGMATDRTAFKRIVVDKEGFVYINSMDATKGGVYRMDPANPSAAFVPVLDVTQKGTIYTTISSMAVEGVGAEKVLYTADDFVSSTTRGSINKYAIGNTLNYAQAPEIFVQNSSDYALGISDNQFVADGRGGFWGVQHRWGYDVWAAVYHINSSKVRDYVIMQDVNTDVLPQTGDVTTYRGVVAINESKNLLAIPTKSRVVVYNIAYDATTGVPTLTEAYRTSNTVFGTNIDGIAFDYADNLYVVSASKEMFYAYAPVVTAANNTRTTPAPTTQSIEVVSSIVNVTGVTLDQSTADMKVGGTLPLTATVTPADATDKSVTWSSSDETVATVAGGTVTAHKAGTATITVTTVDGSFTDDCVVTVTNYDVESVALNRSKLTLAITGYPSFTLVPTITPANATIKTVKWTSSDESVATVSAAGLVTAQAAGTANITVTTDDQSKTAVCVVNVRETAEPNIYAYGLSVDAIDEGKIYYSLNADATALKIQLLKNDAVKYEENVTVPENLAKGSHEYTLSVSEITKGEYTWRVVAEAEDNYSFFPVFEHATTMGKRVFATIDNSPESNYMGRIYIEDHFDGNGTGKVYIVNSDWSDLGNGLYGMAKIQSAGRPSVDSEGYVWWADYGDSHGGLWVMDPKELTTTAFFDGTQDGDGVWTNGSGVEMGSSTPGCHVYGSGKDTKVFMANEDDGTSLVKNGYLVYNVGQTDGSILRTWDSAPSQIVPVANNANGNFAVVGTSHGVFLCQHRGVGSNNSAAYSLMFYDNDGVQRFVSSDATYINGSFGSGLAVSKDETQLIMVNGSGNILHFDLSWNGDVPTLTYRETYNTPYNTIGSLNFDYAGNIVATGGTWGTSMKLYIYAAPKESNTSTTPAPAAQTITITSGQEPTGLENTTDNAKYMHGVWTITGQYLGESADNLQKGIYIINGKKVVK